MDLETAATRSRGRVDSAIDRLQHEFGPFDIHTRETRVDPRSLEEYASMVDRGIIGGAGAWVVDDDGRVLLVRKTGTDGWCEPSGRHEPGESLVETARRETREETGLTVTLEDVTFAQRFHVSTADRTDAAIHRLLVVFSATPTGGRLRPEPGEIAAVDWFASWPDEVLYEELSHFTIPAAPDDRPPVE